MGSKLFIGIGIPASGKTTFLKEFATKNQFIYICPDEIREQLTGDASDQSKNHDVWNTVDYSVEKELERGNTVVLDATMNNPTIRKKYIALAKKYDAEIVGVYFSISLEQALERNRNRLRFVPEEIITRMHTNLLKFPPTTDEGFTSLTTLGENLEPLNEIKPSRTDFKIS